MKEIKIDKNKQPLIIIAEPLDLSCLPNNPARQGPILKLNNFRIFFIFNLMEYINKLYTTI